MAQFTSQSLIDLKRLAILSTHPIQYQTPWFRALASHPGIDLEVFYCHRATPEEQAAGGFGVQFDWDVSLLDGYEYRFLKNVAVRPSVRGFGGLDTPGIKEIIERGRYDSVIVNGWHYKSAWQAMRACWKTQTPLMVRSDSHLGTERSISKRVVKWPLYSWFIPKLNACLPAGKLSLDYFLHYGARPERVFIVPHTVDQDYFTGESSRWLSTRNELRAKWGIASSATVFLFAGKFVPKKRPMDFVMAIDGAKREGKLQGLMAGDGPLRAACEAEAARLQAPISFTGFLNQSEIARAYVAADALVLPSDGGETWGLVVNEAMVCGRPCFVSDRVGCGPDLIITGETGEVFPMGDVGALASLMSHYASRPRELTRMGVRAQGQMTGHSVEAAVDGVLKAIGSTRNGS